MVNGKPQPGRRYGRASGKGYDGRQARRPFDEDPRALMSKPESHLEMAARHIAEQQDRIARQKRLLAKLRRDGHPTEQAEDLLRDMERLLLQMQRELEMLSS